jgi:hypothetical protein
MQSVFSQDDVLHFTCMEEPTTSGEFHVAPPFHTLTRGKKEASLPSGECNDLYPVRLNLLAMAYQSWYNIFLS